MDTRAMRGPWRAILLMLCIMVTGACSSDTSEFQSEGSVAEPIDVGPAPATYSGTVGQGGESYFLSGAEAGDWLVAISNIDGEPDLYIYSDAAYSSQVCGAPLPDAEPESCSVTCDAPCNIYIQVAGSANSGASFNLSITEETDTAASRRKALSERSALAAKTRSNGLRALRDARFARSSATRSH